MVVIVLTNAMGTYPAGIGKNIIKIIDYFQENWNSDSRKFEKYEGRFMSLWSAVDIIAAGNKLAVNFPRSYEPFRHTEQLGHLNGNTFKIVEADSFSSEGELVEFRLKQNTVEAVSYAGEELLPEEIYMKRLEKFNLIDAA